MFHQAPILFHEVIQVLALPEPTGLWERPRLLGGYIVDLSTMITRRTLYGSPRAPSGKAVQPRLQRKWRSA
jgi:hypothetical protein